MLEKEFLPYDQVRNNSIKLGHEIIDSGFIPDIIYVLLRGGAYLGNVISEIFKVRQIEDVLYAAIFAKSYSGVRESGIVKVEGSTYDFRNLRSEDKVLLVDDIFDSGNTINVISNLLVQAGIQRDNLKIAVHDYKIKHFCEVQKSYIYRPDYWCRKHEIEKKEEDQWIHYLSHELIGLTEKEKKKQYFGDDPSLDGLI